MASILYERDVFANKSIIGVRFDDYASSEHLLAHILSEAGRLIAERWVAENYQEAVKHISPEAVATLAAAEAGAAINKTLKENISPRIQEVVKREIYQRGIIGGMKRIG